MPSCDFCIAAALCGYCCRFLLDALVNTKWMLLRCRAGSDIKYDISSQPKCFPLRQHSYPRSGWTASVPQRSWTLVLGAGHSIPGNSLLLKSSTARTHVKHSICVVLRKAYSLLWIFVGLTAVE